MIKINPNDLNGARTYFTGFDTKSYITKDKQTQQKILERTLKVLLLTKNKIVFGASHLKNDLALAVLANDKEKAQESLSDVLANYRADWELKTTTNYLEIITQRKESKKWISKIIKSLKTSIKST